MRDPVTDLDRRGRLIFAGALLFALGHALLYAAAIPEWDLFDEEQHLSYALYLADEGRIPRIDDPVQRRVLENAIAVDRWSTFRIDRPLILDPDEFGLEGLSYEGYQPPLYYALIAPLTWLAGDDAWWELHLARAFGALLLFAFASVAWGYARDWLPDADPAVWGAIVVTAVAIPAVAEAAGRASNDLLAGLFLAAGTLMASRLLEDRRIDQALFLGLLGAAAVLTKGHGVVLLMVTVVALGLLLYRRQLTPVVFCAALLPGVVAFIGWGLWTQARYGTFNGSNAFLDMVVPFESLGVPSFLEELWFNAWSSYWGAYDGGWLRWVTGMVILGIVIAGMMGLLAGRDDWGQTAEGRQRLILSGALALGLLAALWAANASGLAHPHGRMLIGIFPALVTLTAAGLRRIGGDLLAAQLGFAAVALSGLFFLYWFLPFFY